MQDVAEPLERRVVVYAPVGRDGTLTADLLGRDSIPATVCGSVGALIASLADGAAAVILTEEALDEPGFNAFPRFIDEQPPWSDIPILVFAGSEASDASFRTIRMVEVLRNVTIIERPIRVAAVLSMVRAAIRARRRQYEMRDLLVALDAARRQAEVSSRLKDEFLATLSHELRTPLNAILGWTMMLRHGQVQGEHVAKALDTVDRNARAQAQLIEDVLDVARVITGKLRLELTTVDVRAVVLAAVDGLRPAAKAKGVRIVIEAADDLPLINADGARLQQIVWNLVSNALKFTPARGEVAVRVSRSGAELIIRVSDTGIGLSPEFLPFVFDRFRQADQSQTRAHGGLGLGLAIVKHLVELHGGTISAFSDGPGRGATFTVSLPMPLAIGPAVELRSTFEETRNPFAVRLIGRAVLVVDDDATTRDLLREMLGRTGATVCVGASAAEALELLSSRRFDLVISDIGMPGEDGITLMRRVRSMPGVVSRVPSIALSAYTRNEDRRAAKDAGFTTFIAKPASPHDILIAVQSLVGDHAAAS